MTPGTPGSRRLSPRTGSWRVPPGWRPTALTPGDAEVMIRIGRERGFGPIPRAESDRKTLPDWPDIVGSPDQVVEKILLQHEIFGHQRTLFQLAIGSVGHADLMRAIELLGTEVAPAVRAELGSGLNMPAVAAALS